MHPHCITPKNQLVMGFPNSKCAFSVRPFAVVRVRRCASAASMMANAKPRPGDLTASELVKYLWNEVQFADDYPAPALEFFSDDVVYEDMIYPEPFVGKDQVTSFLSNTKDKAPEDFVFVLDKCSDGVKSCGFTWHIELKTRPDAGKFANGCSFYELNSEGKICYVRDIPEPPIKIGSFGLVLANLAAKAIKSRPPPQK
jgi:hypothetical protein